jgi:hypothetical protein
VRGGGGWSRGLSVLVGGGGRRIIFLFAFTEPSMFECLPLCSA